MAQSKDWKRVVWIQVGTPGLALLCQYLNKNLPWLSHGSNYVIKKKAIFQNEI